MTLIVAVTTRDTIWLAADRRLSAEGIEPIDDARKIMSYEIADDCAILGYAGLGRTAKGTEISDWMSNVLRGRNFSVELALSTLTRAAQEQLPSHIGPSLNHCFIVPAFVGNEPRVYVIELFRQTDAFRRLRFEPPISPWIITLGGSGGLHLAKNTEWMRPLFRMLKHYRRGQLSVRSIADHLAMLTHKVHTEIGDVAVGPRCIVAWRHRRAGPYKGGGAQMCYTCAVADRSGPTLPTILGGFDVRPLFDIVASELRARVEAKHRGDKMPEIDKDEINTKLRSLPYGPDETLK